MAWQEEGFTSNVVFDGEYLYVFATYDPHIRVYDKTGNALVNQVLAVPEPYQFNPLDVPTLLNGLIRIKLVGVASEYRNDQDVERLAYQNQRAAKDRYFGAGANGIQAECEWVA